MPRLTIAEGHALILHDVDKKQAFTDAIVQFGIVRGEPRNPTKRNNPCSDPFGDRSQEPLRSDSNNAARKFRTRAIDVVAADSSLSSIVMRGRQCVGKIAGFGKTQHEPMAEQHEVL